MTETTALQIAARSRNPIAPHEVLDAYWFAQMLLFRALRVAAYAQCMTTIGRRLETALDRAIRLIAEAADGTPDRANARLGRAREAIYKALVLFDALLLKRGVREVVVVELRQRAVLLLDRLQMLEGQAVKVWPASNYLPTVLEEARTEVDGNPSVDVVTAALKVPEAAVRELPEPIVADDFLPHPPPRRDGERPTPLGKKDVKQGASPAP